MAARGSETGIYCFPCMASFARRDGLAIHVRDKHGILIPPKQDIFTRKQFESLDLEAGFRLVDSQTLTEMKKAKLMQQQARRAEIRASQSPRSISSGSVERTPDAAKERSDKNVGKSPKVSRPDGRSNSLDKNKGGKELEKTNKARSEAKSDSGPTKANHSSESRNPKKSQSHVPCEQVRPTKKTLSDPSKNKNHPLPTPAPCSLAAGGTGAGPSVPVRLDSRTSTQLLKDSAPDASGGIDAQADTSLQAELQMVTALGVAAVLEAAPSLPPVPVPPVDVSVRDIPLPSATLSPLPVVPPLLPLSSVTLPLPVVPPPPPPPSVTVPLPSVVPLPIPPLPPASVTFPSALVPPSVCAAGSTVDAREVCVSTDIHTPILQAVTPSTFPNFEGFTSSQGSDFSSVASSDLTFTEAPGPVACGPSLHLRERDMPEAPGVANAAEAALLSLEELENSLIIITRNLESGASGDNSKTAIDDPPPMRASDEGEVAVGEGDKGNPSEKIDAAAQALVSELLGRETSADEMENIIWGLIAESDILSNASNGGDGSDRELVVRLQRVDDAVVIQASEPMESVGDSKKRHSRKVSPSRKGIEKKRRVLIDETSCEDKRENEMTTDEEIEPSRIRALALAALKSERKAKAGRLNTKEASTPPSLALAARKALSKEKSKSHSAPVAEVSGGLVTSAPAVSFGALGRIPRVTNAQNGTNPAPCVLVNTTTRPLSSPAEAAGWDGRRAQLYPRLPLLPDPIPSSSGPVSFAPSVSGSSLPNSPFRSSVAPLFPSAQIPLSRDLPPFGSCTPSFSPMDLGTFISPLSSYSSRVGSLPSPIHAAPLVKGPPPRPFSLSTILPRPPVLDPFSDEDVCEVVSTHELTDNSICQNARSKKPGLVITNPDGTRERRPLLAPRASLGFSLWEWLQRRAYPWHMAETLAAARIRFAAADVTELALLIRTAVIAAQDLAAAAVDHC